jgi:hypothetical protein
MPKKINWYTVLKTTSFVLFVLALSVYVLGHYASNVLAAPPTNRNDVMTTLTASTASSHDISFTMTASTAFAAGETISFDFNEDGGGFVVNGASDAVADYDFNDGTERTIVDVDGDCTGHSGSNDVVVGVNDTTGVVTVTACGSMTSSSSNAVVNFEFGTAAGGTNRVTNPGAGNPEITIAGSYGDDSADIEIEIITNDTVSVSASVDETMNFAISDNTIGFGPLTSANARYATGDTNGTTSETEAHTLIVGTNGASGFTLTVNGITLTASGGTIDAIGSTNTASSAGSEQYGVRFTASGGSGTVSAPYAAAGFALDTAAFPDEVGASAGTSADTTFSARYIANIASNTDAGAYTSTLTYIATGRF